MEAILDALSFYISQTYPSDVPYTISTIKNQPVSGVHMR